MAASVVYTINLVIAKAALVVPANSVCGVVLKLCSGWHSFLWSSPPHSGVAVRSS
jgi:hypothetical protein